MASRATPRGMSRRTVLASAAGAAAAAATSVGRDGAAQAQGQPPLRVAITASEYPWTMGQPNQGYEGFRFGGFTLFDALIQYKLDDPNIGPTLIPNLATEWAVDANDKRQWVFKLRRGVKFHDGSDFNADAVIWNFEKLFNDKSPQFDLRQTSQVRPRIPSARAWRKIDDYTVHFTTDRPDSTFPTQIAHVLYSSPAQWEKMGRDWNKFALEPSGTGPFKMSRLIPRERAEFVRNEQYWDEKRRPKTERLIVLPIPEATTRANALLSGQVDMIDAPPPDVIPRLRQRGFVITQNIYPHSWNWYISHREGSPWRDVRVRRALNLAVDREGIVRLLGGFAAPAQGNVIPSSVWRGNPSFKLRYDPAEARRLLAQAGFGANNPLTMKILVAASGSGEMLPMPMNEFIQENFKEVGVNIEFEVVEWQQKSNCRRAGVGAPICRGVIGQQAATTTQDPFSAFKRSYHSTTVNPNGFNFGYHMDPKYDELIDRAFQTFDEAEQNRLLAQAEAHIVDQALDLFVVHDVGPRALSPKVRGWVHAQNWFQDLAPVYMAP
ncbi:MAG: ABC transporter substrate-binding protein [Alphaproteobacteria bacterium]|nr:ABC transporter substrate-binding protein [Alphaproteobacteria bacterium]